MIAILILQLEGGGSAVVCCCVVLVESSMRRMIHRCCCWMLCRCATSYWIKTADEDAVMKLMNSCKWEVAWTFPGTIVVVARARAVEEEKEWSWGRGWKTSLGCERGVIPLINNWNFNVDRMLLCSCPQQFLLPTPTSSAPAADLPFDSLDELALLSAVTCHCQLVHLIVQTARWWWWWSCVTNFNGALCHQFLCVMFSLLLVWNLLTSCCLSAEITPPTLSSIKLSIQHQVTYNHSSISILYTYLEEQWLMLTSFQMKKTKLSFDETSTTRSFTVITWDLSITTTPHKTSLPFTSAKIGNFSLSAWWVGYFLGRNG